MPVKKTTKNIQIPTKKRRLATYIGGPLLDWIDQEIQRIESNESAFIRMALKEKNQRETSSKS